MCHVLLGHPVVILAVMVGRVSFRFCAYNDVNYTKHLVPFAKIVHVGEAAEIYGLPCTGKRLHGKCKF